MMMRMLGSRKPASPQGQDFVELSGKTLGWLGRMAGVSIERTGQGNVVSIRRPAPVRQAKVLKMRYLGQEGVTPPSAAGPPPPAPPCCAVFWFQGSGTDQAGWYMCCNVTEQGGYHSYTNFTPATDAVIKYYNNIQGGTCGPLPCGGGGGAPAAAPPPAATAPPAAPPGGGPAAPPAGAPAAPPAQIPGGPPVVVNLPPVPGAGPGAGPGNLGPGTSPTLPPLPPGLLPPAQPPSPAVVPTPSTGPVPSGGGAPASAPAPSGGGAPASGPAAPSPTAAPTAPAPGTQVRVHPGRGGEKVPVIYIPGHGLHPHPGRVSLIPATVRAGVPVASIEKLLASAESSWLQAMEMILQGEDCDATAAQKKAARLAKECLEAYARAAGDLKHATRELCRAKKAGTDAYLTPEQVKALSALADCVSTIQSLASQTGTPAAAPAQAKPAPPAPRTYPAQIRPYGMKKTATRS